MKTLVISTMIAGLTLANAPAHAGGFDGFAGGLAGGIAGGIIAGAIASSMLQQQQPHTVYVPLPRSPRRAQAKGCYRPRPPVVRTVVTPVPVAAPVPVAVPVPVAASAPANNNNIVVAPAPAPAPIIINNTPALAPAPIVINTATPAPAPTQAAPTSAVADRCQQDFTKTADYLACLKGTPVAAATK